MRVRHISVKYGRLKKKFLINTDFNSITKAHSLITSGVGGVTQNTALLACP